MAKKKKLSRKKRILRLRILVLLVALILIAGIAGLLHLIFSDGYTLSDESDPVATLTLSNGKRVIVELYKDIAPETVASFIYLANSGFYDGLALKPSGDGSRLQTGDNALDGTGNAGYSIKGEFALNGFENALSHTRGTLSMARLTGYDSASSQFFIALADMPYLDGAYASFGTVVKGMEHLSRLSGTQGTYIKSIRVDAKEFSYDFQRLPLVTP